VQAVSPNREEQRDPYAKGAKLDDAKKTQAERHSAPPALVIHEIIRDEGEAELSRAAPAIGWSGLAAGLSMGFSFLSLALIQSALPDAPWRPLVDSLGYAIGFVIVVLGRQQLFTESTLSAVLPLLVRRDAATFFALMRFWAVVLVANVLGTLVFAAMLSLPGLFTGAQARALADIAAASVSEPFWPTLVKAIFAGWLIALMIWLLPGAKSARLLVILLLTYVVALGRFSHIIAGSVEGFYAVFVGRAEWDGYVTGFFLPTIIGNTIGGVALVAILNHAPLAPELEGAR